MDTYIPKIPIGNVMLAGAVGQVVESKKPGLAKGDLVQGLFGWEDYTVSAGGGLMGLQKLPAGTDPLLALSLLGTTGLTAYFGTLAVGNAKAGRNFRGIGRGGCDRLSGGYDREDQRMPRDRNRRRTREMRMAH